ncbi:dockerin type I domain-containing protein (plasmid) [Methylomonas sp. MS20]|uniref:dockerin type I domain-containing protein n=1 Tax=Methylomonas sp. MS20 TaxID=3418769 RepID=UPI003D092D39
MFNYYRASGIYRWWLFLLISVGRMAYGYEYDIVDIKTLAEKDANGIYTSCGSTAYGLNILGQVVGRSYVGINIVPTAFMTDADGANIRAVGDNHFNSAIAINDSGQVLGSSDGVGAYITGQNGQNPVLAYPNIENTDSGAFLIPYARALNNSGQIAGYLGATLPNNYNDYFENLFVTDPNDGALKNLGTLYRNVGGTLLPDLDERRAFGINNAGQLVGGSASQCKNQNPDTLCLPSAYQEMIECGAFVTGNDGKGVTCLGSLGSSIPAAHRGTKALAINDKGTIVGYGSIGNTNFGDPEHAFITNSGDTKLTDIGTLGGYSSRANNINNLDQFVGHYTTSNGGRAFLGAWNPDEKDESKKITRLDDLNKLIDPANGWIITDAVGINDKGQIAANGYNPMKAKTNSEFACEHALLLTQHPPCNDEDGDALCDDWETDGVRTESGVVLNLKAMGANPKHKDIFVEVDYLVANDHSHKPEKGAIDLIVEAFAKAPVSNPDGKTGITLHVDCGRECVMNPQNGDLWGETSASQAILEDKYKVLGSSTEKEKLEADIKNIRDNYFANNEKTRNRKHVFHYSLFAHEFISGTIERATGYSLLPVRASSTFIVTLGTTKSKIGTFSQQAGTFMHELGHNLGLHHGGVDHISFKPNYLSVMNYAFQKGGILRSDGIGYPDYSRFSNIPTLSEISLNEKIGVNGGAATMNLKTRYYIRWRATICEQMALPGEDCFKIVKTNEPIDWNGSCSILSLSPCEYETSVSEDINGPWPGADIFEGNDHLTNLVSYNDWDRLIYDGSGEIGAGSVGDSNQNKQYLLPFDEATTTLLDNIKSDYEIVINRNSDFSLSTGGYKTVYFAIENEGLNLDEFSIITSANMPYVDFSQIPDTIELDAGEVAEFPITVTRSKSAGAKIIEAKVMVSGKSADEITINVYAQGDISLDGSIDIDDLNLVRAKLNTFPDSYSAHYDLNGDSRIDAVDARLLVNLCTKPRCAK